MCCSLYLDQPIKAEGVTTYRIPSLPKEAAYDLLLGNIRPGILTAWKAGCHKISARLL